MSLSKKQSQLEIDIENARSQKDWGTVWNLFRKYAKINPDSLLEQLAHAEHALDNYDLSQARACLEKAKAIDPENEEVFALYGRLEYIAKDIDKAFGYLSLIHLPPPEHILFPRTLRLLLQSWQLKGLCQEARHEYKQADNTYKELLDLAVRSYNNLTSIDPLSKPFVETALCNLPLLQFDDVFTSTQLSRRALFVPFELSPNFLHATLRHLAHLLLRETCAASYPQLQEERSFSNLRYTPHTATEEALLALLKSSHDNPSPIDLYEDITLAYSRLNLYSPIVDAYERLLSFQIGDVHQLMQLAMSLMSSGRYRRSLYVLQDCSRRDPVNPVFLLLIVKLCINHLRQTTMGLEYAEKAEKVLEDRPENWVWLARSRLAVGICCGKLALEAKSFEQRKEYQKKALHSLLQARQLDPNDASICFNLALIFADVRDISRALKFVRKSLALDRTNSNAWGLFGLLLSSQKRFTVALTVITQALSEDPTNICLTLIKAKLEQVLDQPVQALQTYRSAFGHYSAVLQEKNPQLPEEPKLGASSVHSGGTAETRTTHRRTVTSIDDNVSVALSHARSHVLSLHTNSKDHPDEVAPKTDPMLTNLWLATAEAFAQAEQYSDAVECLHEARSLDSTSAEVFYQEGCMMEMQDQGADALSQYTRALSIDFNHVMAHIRIAMIYMRIKDYNLAEQMLSTVLRFEPTCHQAWFQLGTVLKEKHGEEKRAAECFQRAVELDKTAPVMPFSTIVRILP
eukprot:Phypoly_transcript_03828.p1 GENE.Phypoly_transcript_03828~~Phypoly_transcript_03828.p1  ORF type:complete len:744 (+),score=125.51 Phypoly_transcript_03828:93-2324(+)